MHHRNEPGQTRRLLKSSAPQPPPPTPPPTPQPPPQGLNQVARTRVIFLCPLAVDVSLHVDGACGAAMRRRQRRLRAQWRHEQQTVAMVLATVGHHSFGPTANDALRSQKPVTRTREKVEGETYDAPRRQKPPPPGACQHLCLRSLAGRRFWCGTLWNTWRMSAPLCRSSMLLCRRWWTQCWSSSVLWTRRLTSRSLQCPRSPLTVSRGVWWSGVSLRW